MEPLPSCVGGQRRGERRGAGPAPPADDRDARGGRPAGLDRLGDAVDLPGFIDPEKPDRLGAGVQSTPEQGRVGLVGAGHDDAGTPGQRLPTDLGQHVCADEHDRRRRPGGASRCGLGDDVGLGARGHDERDQRLAGRGRPGDDQGTA